jgi:hypothetical protein
LSWQAAKTTHPVADISDQVCFTGRSSFADNEEMTGCVDPSERGACRRRSSPCGQFVCKISHGKEAALNPQRLRLIGVGLTATACAFGLWHAEQLAADVKFFGKKAGKPAAAAPSNGALEQALQQAEAENAKPSQRVVGGPSEKTIKMSYFSRTWDDVLNDVAKQSGRQLVIDKVPSGRFSRNDWSRYSLDETIRILNRELEPKGFRLLERGKFLDVVPLRDARSEYSRPLVGMSDQFDQNPAVKSANENTPLAAKFFRMRAA